MSTSIRAVAQVSKSDIGRIGNNSTMISSQAMALTDAWGAMFEMERGDIEAILKAIGFNNDIVTNTYDAALNLKYVDESTHDNNKRHIFTWHGSGDIVQALRGYTDTRATLSTSNDGNIDSIITANKPLFYRLMAAMPSYSRKHMFSPEVASNVLGVNGAKVSADKPYELAKKFGGLVTRDNEGRRGVSAQFIRSLHLMLAAVA